MIPRKGNPKILKSSQILQGVAVDRCSHVAAQAWEGSCGR